MEIRDFLAESLSGKLFETLERCAIRGEALYTDSYLRGIGKTTAVFEFAKKYDLYVVVSRTAQEKALSETFGYEKVISQDRLTKLRGLEDVHLVFDEGVDLNKMAGFKVVTGIVNKF